jgi:hypothetical protein
MNNNNIGGFTFNSGTTTLSTNFFGISVAPTSTTTLNINSNIIGSSTVANSLNQISTSTAAVSITGISVTAGAPIAATFSINGNTLANWQSLCTSTGIMRGIVVSIGTPIISNNIIRNFNTFSAAVGTGGSTAICGIANSATTSTGFAAQCFNNQIYALKLSNTSTSTSFQITGVSWAPNAVINNLFYNNSIHSFETAITATTATAATFTGVDFGSGTSTLYNNMIRFAFVMKFSDYFFIFTFDNMGPYRF